MQDTWRNKKWKSIYHIKYNYDFVKKYKKKLEAETQQS